MSFWGFLATVVPVDLLQGLKITGGFLFKRKVTVQYPDKRLEPADRFRGMLGYSEERCNLCRGCAKACPIKIIHIEGHLMDVDVEGKKRKKAVIDRYDIDVKRCMFCGLCEEACPTQAVWLTTKTYETAAYERNERLYFNKERLGNWDGVRAYPGVINPVDGQDPGDPLGRKKGAPS
jgi:NADH-quinone oxidoreductase subunit I